MFVKKPAIALVLTAIVAGCTEINPPGEVGPAASNPVSVEKVASEFAGYRKMTEEETFVNPELARLCVGASAAMVTKAAETHGPHANTAILVFMNESAATVFENENGPYPAGAVIVKRKSIGGHRDSTTGEWVRRADTGVGGMIKRAPGYDPENGNWEYFYFEDEGEIESGRIGSCIDCHAGASDTDHVFGSWRDQSPPGFN